MFKRIYLRIRYWRQIRKGYGLLSDLGTKKSYAIANNKAFFMNGHDPLMCLDLTTNKVNVYTPPKDAT